MKSMKLFLSMIAIKHLYPRPTAHLQLHYTFRAFRSSRRTYDALYHSCQISNAVSSSDRRDEAFIFGFALTAGEV